MEVRTVGHWGEKFLGFLSMFLLGEIVLYIGSTLQPGSNSGRCSFLCWNSPVRICNNPGVGDCILGGGGGVYARYIKWW